MVAAPGRVTVDFASHNGSETSIFRQLAVALALIIPTLSFAKKIDCRVVVVHDGDHLTWLTAAKQQTKVRLAEIDTSESKQPYGNRAQQSLAAMLFSKDVRLDVPDTDRYGRWVARVQGNTDVNAEQLRQGAVRGYCQYLKDRSLLHLESQAKAQKRSLSALPEAEQVPPWEWDQAARDQRREALMGEEEAPAAIPPKRSASFSQFGGSDSTGAGGSYSCAPTKACRQMTSDAEAKCQLQHCSTAATAGSMATAPGRCAKISAGRVTLSHLGRTFRLAVHGVRGDPLFEQRDRV